MTDKSAGTDSLWEKFLEEFGGEKTTPFSGIDSYMHPHQERQLFKEATETLKSHIKSLRQRNKKNKVNEMGDTHI